MKRNTSSKIASTLAAFGLISFATALPAAAITDPGLPTTEHLCVFEVSSLPRTADAAEHWAADCNRILQSAPVGGLPRTPDAAAARLV
ncbi:hypothetical protein [Aeromicrobium sp.]|uniref:hypothetical protein n=1 Tax=Aeromicrobium sp. TaxID=1871063 RepID=UPI003C5866D8